jgi:UDP-4-amino-4-deoxy-L-arabinose formyltransferase/UDP-glucuronic acid dehydrogenase (UDP-4-keto-hexauronic acid decarboxylating)
VRELAYKLRDMFMSYSESSRKGKGMPQILEVSSKEFYGKGYQDMNRRVPSIKKAREILGWEPAVDLDTALKKTIDYYLAPGT